MRHLLVGAALTLGALCLLGVSFFALLMRGERNDTQVENVAARKRVEACHSQNERLRDEIAALRQAAANP